MPEGGRHAGSAILLRAYLRRDRWLLGWWALGATVLYWSQAVSVEGLYATQAELDRAAAAMAGNPALVAMTGPARALDTIGGQVTWQASAFGAVVAGLMSMFVVGRHTRGEEESGRDELVRASAVGRRAPVTATVVELVVANALLGCLVAASLVAVPLAVADSLALGVGAGLSGLAFGGVALLAAQLASTTRATYGMTGAALATAYALRAVGDVGPEALSWLSPIGWYQRMHPFSGLRWWPALLLAGLAVVALAAAYAVLERRDLGSGVLAARPGPRRASALLGTPVGLAWRLQRTTLLAWAVGLGLTGLAYGWIGDGAGDLVGDSPAAEQLMTGGTGELVAGFQAVSMVMLAMLTAGFAISSALRPRTEEESGRLEPLLATGTSRSHWLGGHVVVTVVGSAVVLAAGGLGLGVGYALATGEEAAAQRLAGETLSWLPAVLVLSGLTRFLHGLRPRLAALGWLGLAYAVVVLVLAEPLRIPGWLRDLSPFEQLALVPVDPFDPVAFAGVLGAATLLALGGWFAFTRRDIG